ncbi:hypothetical protein [Lacticaseibacillus zhaodongensis]|uniref:hypothetical protein n=1 Tax=Lacticaseibacillus zhaodongensis TaxID=2668065 RepID=UPI0012D2ABB6|nr:hypothetical protein [Lacticaseibacillus zhaodongensis]
MSYAAMFLGLALVIIAVFEFRKAYSYTHMLNTNGGSGMAMSASMESVCGYACAAIMLIGGIAVMSIEFMNNL